MASVCKKYCFNIISVNERYLRTATDLPLNIYRLHIIIMHRYAHVQALLDVFIFQNPLQPVTHFEYYSENLKKQYRESLPDPDLDFLNNIEKNVFGRTTDKYKWIWVKCFLYEYLYLTSLIHMPKSLFRSNTINDDYYVHHRNIFISSRVFLLIFFFRFWSERESYWFYNHVSFSVIFVTFPGCRTAPVFTCGTSKDS